MSDTPLRIIPLGGLGEIGKNMMAYEYGEDILIVDTGLMFPPNDLLGVDYIIPDFQYLYDKAHRVKGIVYTHGHEDHTGAVRHVLERIPAPMYATPLTKGLLEVKLKGDKILRNIPIHEVKAGERVRIGPFSVEFIHVTHSIPDAVALAISTPQGVVIHTGDYKFDQTPIDGKPTDFAALASYARRGRGVLALLADSTNADKPGWTPSERVITPALEAAMREAPGRVLVATFASLISRMQQVAEVALRLGRKIAFVGTSMVENARMARQLGYLRIPDESWVSLEEALKLPPQEVVLMVTGSQGEPSSILGRLAGLGGRGRRPFNIEPGDTVIIAAHPIPGNAENVYRTINRLIQRGANVLYDPVAQVHVSGHASQEEMKLMLNLVQPRYFIPIHGELRHLVQHARLAQQVGIPADRIAVVENGHVIEFRRGQMQVTERVPGGWVFVEGGVVSDTSIRDIWDRQDLARRGLLLVQVPTDAQTGRLAGPIDITTRGFSLPEGGDEFLALLRRRIKRALARGDVDDLEKVLTSIVQNLAYTELRRRPVVVVILKSRAQTEGDGHQKG
ncbi:MAG: ribonuclease J [Chloroflexi bacterium]|nr:ribonuclease J [Chloroflexota bacterium]